MTEESKPEHIKCVWGIVCSQSSIDQQKNNISLFNVIDQLNIPKDEFVKVIKEGKEGMMVQESHEIVTMWRRTIDPQLYDTDIETEMNISFVDPDGNVVNEAKAPMKFEAGKRNLRFRVQNNMFKVTKRGDYIYRIEIKQPGSNIFTKAFEIPLHVQDV